MLTGLNPRFLRYERKQAQRAREQEAAAAAAAAAARAEEEQRKAKEAAAAASAYSGAAAPAPAPAPAAGGVRRLARPTTARRRPPRVRENVQQVEGAEAVKPSLAVGIMAEGEQSDSDDDIPDEPVPETKGCVPCSCARARVRTCVRAFVRAFSRGV